MRLLLDTHIYLWALTDDRKLTPTARQLIQDAEEIYVSSASIWEASIKIGLGKLDADINQLVNEIEACGFRELSVCSSHAARVCTLPDIHRDPFDRMLIAQALCEPLRLLTADHQLAAYTELTLIV